MVNKAILLSVTLIVILALSAAGVWADAGADTTISGLDVKWSQPPDMKYGVNIQSTEEEPIVADDWNCTDPRPVTDVHFWGSYIGWETKSEKPQSHPPVVEGFMIRIYEDVPAGVDQSYSHPGELLCEEKVWGFEEMYVAAILHPDETYEHKFYYSLDLPEPFKQKEGTIYWISIAAIMPDEYKYPWGWETSTRHWNDDACRWYHNNYWEEILPSQLPLWYQERCKTVDMAFELTVGSESPPIKWQQRPDMVQGTNVISIVDGYGDDDPKSLTVADDWLCLDGSPVTDLHFWGSYSGWYPDKVPRDPDTPPGIKEFRVRIYSDIPAVIGRDGFSRPGKLLYEVWVDDFTETYVDSILHPRERYEHKYRYDMDLPKSFPQERDTIYWLSIAAVTLNHTHPWGWESSMDRWNDFAVQGWYADPDNSKWDMIHHPWTERHIDMAFELTTGEGPIKWLQFPDMANGVNILSLPEDPVVADDWLCTDGKPITEVHFWGSYLSREKEMHWEHENPGPPEKPLPQPPGIAKFKFSFHKDIPAGIDPEMPWSHPGELLHEVWMDPDEVKERYWDSIPHTGVDGNIWWEHKFYYIACLKEPFEQKKGTIYWLDIGAKPVEDEWYWGWETSVRHWNDNAVRGWENGNWWECLGAVTIDFEDLTPGTKYKVGDTFTTSGIPVTVRQFQWGGMDWYRGGYTVVNNNGDAGGSGNDMNTNNVNLDFGFDAPNDGLSLLFGEYGGNLNIEVNGDSRNFDKFADINGLTIGGVHVTVVDLGDSKGRLVLTGTIEQFAIGGQEFLIDDVEFVKRVDMAFALMTETVTPRMDWGDAPEGAAAPGYPTLATSNGARHTIVPGFYLGPTVRVSQESSPGAGDFDANVLGYVSPYATSLSTVGYYQYGTPHAASFNGPAPMLTSDRSHLFLADAADGLSLFVVHDKPNDGCGGFARMHWTLAGDTAGVRVPDDPSETVTVTGGGTIFDSHHGWDSCCTDGMAFGSLDGAWTMIGAMTGNLTGMDEWHVYSSDNSSIALSIELNRRVRLDYQRPIDPEPDGQPDPNALGDDNDGNDDENGVVFETPLAIGQQATVTVTASAQGLLQGWIDFNEDRDWADSGEQIFVNKPLVAGPNVLTFNVPVTLAQADAFATFARFRFSRVRDLSFDGPARDGEVEDYKVRIDVRPTADLGDAPDSTNSFSASMTAYQGVQANFPTVYGAGSPPHGPIHRHPKALAFLGQSVSLESEADVGPDGDWVNNIEPQSDAANLDGADDGVKMPLVLVHCKPNTFDYVVTVIDPLHRSVYVNVWFDWNRDGDWDDVMKCPDVVGTVAVAAPEWAVQNQQLHLSGPGVFTFTTPRFMAWLPPQVEAEPSARWMRITLSERKWAPFAGVYGVVAPNAGGSGPAGGYQYGETEDYPVKCVQSQPNTKWVQLPDMTPNGIDIKVDDMHILADDFECTSPSLLTDVHFWGSWKHDDKGEIKRIHLRIHSDDPVGIGGSDKENKFSKPDKQLWACDFSPDEFEESLYYTATDRGAWWWDPAKEELIEGGDKQVWRYDIKIDPDEAFLQRGTRERPIIYWLDLRVTTADGEFGWKTRQWPDHFMDDAVWDRGSELPRNWNELRYPTGHPYHGLERDSIDMAFMLTFEELDWGDAPDPRYPTLLDSNGASHIIDPGVCLGRWVEADEDGQPSVGAIGDDICDGTDDEDGVTIPPLRAGATTRIRVFASVGGYLNGWFDWNADGDWDDRGEYVISERPIPAGPSLHNIRVPGGAKPGGSYARFRFSTRPLATVLPEPKYKGRAPDGEVEDYRFYVRPTGPDHFEPNDGIGAAFDLGSLNQNRTGLGIHEPGEEDWFEWTALHKGQVNFSVNGNVTLELYDSDGNKLATTGLDKCISWDVAADESYSARIRAADPGMTVLDYGWKVELCGDNDNYALLFSGGSTPGYNYDRYYNNIKEMYETVVDDYDVIPDNIWILYADGTNPAIDQKVLVDPTYLSYYINSDMSYITNGTTVMSGTRANLESVLTTTLPGRVDSNDHFLFYAFDHGSGTSNAPTITEEESLTGWSAGTADNDLKDWLNQVGAGHTTIVHTQCFAGGMLDDLLPLTASTFGCAATNHYEGSYGDGFAGAFAGALKSGYGNAYDAYVYAHDHDTYAITRGTYPDNGGTWTYGKEHPWAASTANFPIFAEETNLMLKFVDDDIMYQYPKFYIGPPGDPLRVTHDMLLAKGMFRNDALGMGFRIEAVNSGSLTKNGVGVVPGKTMIRYGESVVWTPPAPVNSAEESEESGDILDAFTIRAADGATVSDNSVTITVSTDSAGELNAVNDTVEIDEDERGVAIDVLANDSGNGTLVVTGVGQPQRGSALLVKGQVIYTPGSNFHGSDQFTYSVTDSALNTGMATVTVIVRSVNDPPEAYDDHLIVVMDSVNNTIDVLVNDYDLDPDPLTALPNSIPENGSIAMNADGTFSYTPDAGYTGSDSFTYLACDGTDQSMATVIITVTEDANSDWGDAPEFSGSMGGGYPTRAASGGASHTIGGPWLGAMAPDGEADGHPDSVALGDDNNNIDDEDGVSIPGLQQGKTATIEIVVGGGGGYVDAWIDWNGNHLWEHPQEQIHAGHLPDGTHTISVLVPDASITGQTFARFRISSDGGLTPVGSAPDGEVEDYEVHIRASQGYCECGDLNCDSAVTAADAVIALEIAVGIRPNDPAADVDGDGQVTSLDALMILQAAAGQIEIC